jgi:hypothetical protein
MPSEVVKKSLKRTSRANFLELRKAEVQLLRITLLRRWVNEGKKKGRSVPGGSARSGTTIGVGNEHNKRTARRDFRWSMYEN